MGSTPCPIHHTPQSQYQFWIVSSFGQSPCDIARYPDNSNISSIWKKYSVEHRCTGIRGKLECQGWCRTRHWAVFRAAWRAWRIFGWDDHCFLTSYDSPISVKLVIRHWSGFRGLMYSEPYWTSLTQRNKTRESSVQLHEAIGQIIKVWIRWLFTLPTVA